jgi:hypothetical protein
MKRGRERVRRGVRGRERVRKAVRGEVRGRRGKKGVLVQPGAGNVPGVVMVRGVRRAVGLRRSRGGLLKKGARGLRRMMVGSRTQQQRPLTPPKPSNSSSASSSSSRARQQQQQSWMVRWTCRSPLQCLRATTSLLHWLLGGQRISWGWRYRGYGPSTQRHWLQTVNASCR